MTEVPLLITTNTYYRSQLDGRETRRQSKKIKSKSCKNSTINNNSD